MCRMRDAEGPQTTFYDGQSMHAAFRDFSVGRLKTACEEHICTSFARSRDDVYTTIAHAPDWVQDDLRQTVHASVQQGDRKHVRKRPRLTANQTFDAGSARGVEHDDEPIVISPMADGVEDDLTEGVFMKAGSSAVIDGVISEFIDHTGNLAMAVGSCAVCARETSMSDLTERDLDAIPNPSRLHPLTAHPAHDLFKGMLLHPAGMLNGERVYVCIECDRALYSDKIPPLALANGLWIGRVPHELAYLNLPERLLIAKYFPAAYIIKLYPKKKGARHWDKRQLYSGLKGNVSTYQLDQGQISSMVDGTILPQPAKVLAATIGITFVGPKNLPDRGLPDMFKVRRERVRKALEWLKENNPLYSNITISLTRLTELPENDIPYELHATTKLSTDITKLHAEHDGYVPSQEICDDESDNGGAKCHHTFTELTKESDRVHK